MPKYKIDLNGSRTLEPALIVATMHLEIVAGSYETAEEIVRSSLPGFDWKWQSGWGLTNMEEAA